MAVKVHFMPGHTSATAKTYENGASFGLANDGHLVVSKRVNSLSQSDAVALYAPGTWSFAELVPAEGAQ